MTENEQKLLDYFNDYNFIVANDERDTYRPRTEKDWQGMSRPYRQYICSKHFEFVKWLVDNDKIDKKKFEDKFFVCGCCGYKTLSTRETCEACGDEVLDIYEALLMQLAIQNEPIKFLISLLK